MAPTPFLIAAVLLLTPPTALSEASPPKSSLAAVPADAVLVIHGTPPVAGAVAPGSQPAQPNAAEALATLAGMLNAAGLISSDGQVFADLLAWLPLLARYDFAVALLDATASSIPASSPASQPSLRLDQLQFAIILRTGGKNAEVAAGLNRLVSKYTNNELAQLTAIRVGRFDGQSLRDTRLPGWAVWEWCEMEEFFVIAFGSGGISRVADVVDAPRRSLLRDGWYERAHAACGGSAAWFEVYLNHRQAERRLPEELLQRVRAVRDALDSEGVERDLWAIRTSDRQWSIDRFERTGSRDQVHRFGSDEAQLAKYRRFIPPEAKHYAVLNAPLRRLVETIPRAVLAAQSERGAAAMRRWWKMTEADLGVDIDGEIVDRLGNQVIVFDYPPHPLGIPLALTLAVPIRDPDQVRTALGAAFAAWERRLSRHGQSPLFGASVQKTEEGAWYLQAGIVGPALAVTDGFIVISWSPQALREALPFFATPPQAPAARP